MFTKLQRNVSRCSLNRRMKNYMACSEMREKNFFKGLFMLQNCYSKERKNKVNVKLRMIYGTLLRRKNYF